jgi:hypothetical protein
MYVCSQLCMYVFADIHPQMMQKRSLIPRFRVTLFINNNKKLQRKHLKCNKFNYMFILNITENPKNGTQN